MKNDLVPDNASGRFNLHIGTFFTAPNVGDNGTTGEQTVPADTYTVSVTAGTSTSLINYVTTIVCRSENGTGPIVAQTSGPGTSLSVPVEGDADVVCVVTNSVPVPAACTGMTFDRVIFGTEDRDVLTGSGLRDLIYGFGGNDIINGGAGNDCLVGGEGDDLVNAGAGNDKVLGGSGNDRLNGDSGTDFADGGIDSDSCNAENEVACES